MTRKRKTYTITVINKSAMKFYLQELRNWGVDENKYTVSGLTVRTQDANVVDVATETFINANELIEIVTA